MNQTALASSTRFLGGYEEIFQDLMTSLAEKGRENPKAISEFAETVKRWTNKTDLLAHFPKEVFGSNRTKEPAYHRFSIGRGAREKDPYEALLIHWTCGARTNIHGHPDFAFYKVLAGHFRMRLYERLSPDSKDIREKEVLELGPGQTRHSAGPPGRFDNFIHEIECVEEGFTLHFYSDDAKKGESF